MAFKQDNWNPKVKWQIGWNDGSGQDEFYILEQCHSSDNNSIVHGQGDCCKMGGIRDRAIAEQIVNDHNSIIDDN